MSTQRCDIAVIGGGITGAATACALAAASFDVRLIERGAAPAAFDAQTWDPRVYAISPGSAAFLDTLGIWREMLASRRAGAMNRMQVWDRDASRGLSFDASDAGAETLGWIVEHRLLAATLWQTLRTGSARTGVDVQGIDFEEDAVQLSLSDGTRLQARLAIGAEGADSALRDAAGIDTAGWSYDATALVCHVECDLPHRGAALQRFLPAGPVALLPLSDGRRSLVWSTTEADARELLALDDTAFAQHLEEAMQSSAGRIGAITRRLSFPLRLMHAQDYVASRCALVGDSAHLIHPLAGQGLNLGLADARELAQQLDSARQAGRDWSALRTLRRYERARQAENLEMLAITDALGRAFALDLPGWRRLLSFGMQAANRVTPLKQTLSQRAAGPA